MSVSGRSVICEVDWDWVVGGGRAETGWAFLEVAEGPFTPDGGVPSCRLGLVGVELALLVTGDGSIAGVLAN